MLSKYIETNQRNWDEVLPLLLMAFRSSKQESSNFSPCMMMLGREVDLPVDLIYPSPSSEPKMSGDEYVVNLQNRSIGFMNSPGHPLSKRDKNRNACMIVRLVSTPFLKMTQSGYGYMLNPGNCPINSSCVGKVPLR